MSEQEYLEDNIATVAFHLGRPGARLSVQNDMPGLVVDPGEVLKEVSRRIKSHGALVKALEECAAPFSTNPGSIPQCEVEISAEFQRRMNVAGAALHGLVGGSRDA